MKFINTLNYVLKICLKLNKNIYVLMVLNMACIFNARLTTQFYVYLISDELL